MARNLTATCITCGTPFVYTDSLGDGPPDKLRRRKEEAELHREVQKIEGGVIKKEFQRIKELHLRALASTRAEYWKLYEGESVARKEARNSEFMRRKAEEKYAMIQRPIVSSVIYLVLGFIAASLVFKFR
jgi:hypothetical protein